MQVSKIAGLTFGNVVSKQQNNKVQNYNTIPLNNQGDMLIKSNNVKNSGINFEQGQNYIKVVSFGNIPKTAEIFKPAIQMRVQGVKNFQHNMDPEKLKDGAVYAINKLANGLWKDGQSLKYMVSEKVIKLISPEVGEIGKVPAEIAPFLIPLLKDDSKNYEFELSNVIAGNTKGASTIGLRVNLIYKGNSPEEAQEAFDEILNDEQASKKAFFYQAPSTTRDVLNEILKFEEKDNGIESAQKMEKAVNSIVDVLDNPENKNILLIGHCKPDGDTLGCILGLKNSLDMVHPEKHIDCAVDDEVTGLFRHKLPGIDKTVKHPYSQEKINLLTEEIKRAEEKGAPEAIINGLKTSLEKATDKELLLDRNQKYDVVVLMDIPTPTRFSAGFKDYIKDAKQAIYIDHHPYKEEEWDNAKESTGVDMKNIFNNSLAWVAERVPAACEQAAIIASKLSPKTNPLNPDNTILTMNTDKFNVDKLNAAVAAFVTGIWTDTGGFGRTANLVPEDIIDKNGNRVPVGNRPNFLPEGISKWMMNLTSGAIDKKWMRDNISYDINDEKKDGDIEPTAREKMLEIANNFKYENKQIGLGIVNATYEQMQDVLEIAQQKEPETGFLDVQNSFKYSEVMGDFRASELQNGMSSSSKKSFEELEGPGPYDEDKIAIFICENERKGELNTEGKRSTTDALRYSFRSVEGTTHAELLASLFNGGGHGGAAGGQIKGDGVRLNTPLAVKINGETVRNSEKIYKALVKNYEIMHDSKLSAAEKALKRTNIELVQDENGEQPLKIIAKLVREIRHNEPIR